MHTIARNVVYGVTAAMLGAPSEAGGEYGSFAINPYGAYLEGHAYYQSGPGPLAGIVLPEGEGNSSFSFGFTITDQLKNSRAGDMLIVLNYHVTDVNCDIDLRPKFLSVARPYDGHIVGSLPSSGFRPMHGSDSIGEPHLPQQYLFEIRAPDGKDLYPGDAINVGIYRSPGSTVDTCNGDLIIQGIEVAYY